MMPEQPGAGTGRPTAAIKQRTLTYCPRLLFKFSRFLRGPGVRGWLPKLRNPRRNQYKPVSKRAICAGADNF